MDWSDASNLNGTTGEVDKETKREILGNQNVQWDKRGTERRNKWVEGNEGGNQKNKFFREEYGTHSGVKKSIQDKMR